MYELLLVGLIEVIHVAGMFALVVGSELHEKAVVPRDLPVIEAFVSAAVCSTIMSFTHVSINQSIYLSIYLSI